MGYEVRLVGTKAIIEQSDKGRFVSLVELKQRLAEISKQRVVNGICLGGINGKEIQLLDTLSSDTQLKELVLEGEQKIKQYKFDKQKQEKKKKIEHRELANKQSELAKKKEQQRKLLIDKVDLKSKSRLKIISKKQSFIFEWVVYILFFIQAFVLPENLMEYTWAKNFVSFMGSIFPSVENFYNNRHVNPVLPFLYAQMFLLFTFYFNFYFFVDLGVVSKYNPNSTYELKLVYIWVIIFLYILSCFVSLIEIGEYSESGYYGRYEKLFLSKFGAITFGYMSICLFLAQCPHYLYKVCREIVIREKAIKMENVNE